MLSNWTAVIIFLLTWTVASFDVTTDHESTLGSDKDPNKFGQEEQINVSYAGPTENAALDSVMTSKTPARNATGQQVALASYINPSSKNEWDRMIAYPADKVSVLIANVNSGPGFEKSKEWASVIKNANDYGKTVIGYVRTGYLGLSAASGKFGPDPFKTQLGSSELADWIAQIQADVETWYRADTIVTFERSYAEYLNRTQGVIIKDKFGYESIIPEWQPKDDRKYWHIIYDTPQDKIREIVALAKQRHAGLVMVTSATLPNPYGTLPSEEYMKTLLNAVEVGSPLIVPVRPPPGGGPKPPPPTELRASRIEYKSVELQWQVPREAEVMVVYLSGKEVVRLPGNLNRVTVGNLAILSKNLKFKAQAFSKEGTKSEFSNTITVDTKPLPDGGKPIVNVTVTPSANQTKYEADILTPFNFLRLFITDPDSNCTYPAYTVNTDRDFVCAKWMVEGDVFYKYAGTERDPKTKFWPFKWTPSDKLNDEGKNIKIEKDGFHQTWYLPIGLDTVDTRNFAIEGEGISSKTNLFRACPCHWKNPNAIKKEKDGSLKYCDGKQKFCAYKCKDGRECSGGASRAKMCDRAVKEIQPKHTYRSNDRKSKPGTCSKNFFGSGCSVKIRGGKNCEIKGDALKQTYEDIKAGERGSCGNCPGSKDLGNGCSVSIDYVRGCRRLKGGSRNNMAQDSIEFGAAMSLDDGVMYSSTSDQLLG
ncbi:fibronectin type III domain protein [Venturia nashicola]|uniref:Fibronectin type III domain protein n=1 Tax=Venturia nashicola TaxID=86259 RepID=A0A4Z1NWK6_9PEZI|nr:fibronectin type III domain protein [Venturia nashicola]